MPSRSTLQGWVIHRVSKAKGPEKVRGFARCASLPVQACSRGDGASFEPGLVFRLDRVLKQ